MLHQNDLEQINDMLYLGKITLDEANVQIVLCEKVRVVTNSIPKETRKALNNAVKNGILGHYKKDGYKPECYFKPNCDYLARDIRRKYEKNVFESLCKVCAPPIDLNAFNSSEGE